MTVTKVNAPHVPVIIVLLFNKSAVRCTRRRIGVMNVLQMENSYINIE